MASNPYAKSLFWLLSFSGLGYGLMILTTPSQETLAKIRATAGGVHLTEEEQKKLLFFRKLRQAANLKEPVDVNKSDK